MERERDCNNTSTLSLSPSPSRPIIYCLKKIGTALMPLFRLLYIDICTYIISLGDKDIYRDEHRDEREHANLSLYS